MFKLKHFQTEKENCQLILKATGSKQNIIRLLERLLEECKDTYGKPRQGQIIQGDGEHEIITPFWESREF